MTRAFQDHQIRQYLLGDLSAAQESELEAAYFDDSELLARVELARDDLADDYGAARLSAADREKFERRLLATDEGHEEFAVTMALRHAADAVPASRQGPGWSLDRRWLALAAVVPLAIGAFLAWRVVSAPERVDERTVAGSQHANGSTSPTATSPPNTGARDPAVPPGGKSIPGSSVRAPAITLATLILTADLERSGGVPPTLLAAGGATHVDLVAPRIDLKPGAVRARVESVEGALVWSGSVTIPAAEAPDPRPRARVPFSNLPPGDYFFSIETASTDIAGGPYYFRVRAK